MTTYAELPAYRRSVLLLVSAGLDLWRMPDGSCWLDGYGPGNEPVDVTVLADALAGQGAAARRPADGRAVRAVARRPLPGADAGGRAGGTRPLGPRR